MSIDACKLLVICGPTGVGKTALGTTLAKKFNGEIISADSRQVYKSFDIATGKDLKELAGVNIHLVDIAEPDERFSVARYCALAKQVLEEIRKNNHLPIVVGGTGFYVNALVDGVSTINIPPNENLRKKYRTKSVEELLMVLARLDSELANSLSKSEQYNKQRLIRRIEIAQTGSTTKSRKQKAKNYNSLFIGLTCPTMVLRQRISKRIDGWIKEGTEEEVRTLLDQGVSWESQAMSALGYRQWQPYFANKATREEVVSKWKTEEYQYAKRQMTWFKKDKRIVWFDITESDWQKKVEKAVSNWYN